MMNIKKIFTVAFFSCLFFVAWLLLVKPVGAGGGPTIFFEPLTVNTKQNENFDIKVMIDVGDRQIFGADAVINYPASDLTVKSIAYGNFFSDNIAPSQTDGQIILRGSFFSSSTGFGGGSGTFATLTFSPSKSSGTGKITFTCSSSGVNTDIIDSSGTNILPCSLTYATLNYSTTTSAPATSSNGPTNACGGTCGSVYNCNVNLFCYQGYCRNPDCPSESACGCSTPAPTPVPTKKPLSKPITKGAVPTPTLVALKQYTPPPPFIPEPTTPVEVATEEGTARSLDIRTIGMVAGGIILGIAGLMLLISRIKKRPPKFTPPTGEGFNPPPANPPVTPPPGF